MFKRIAYFLYTCHSLLHRCITNNATYATCSAGCRRVVLLVFDVVLIVSEVLFVAIDEWREDPGDATSIVISSVGSCGFIG